MTRSAPHEDGVSSGSNQQHLTVGQVVCDGPYCEYHKVKVDTLKWLEMAIAVDGRLGQYTFFLLASSLI